jgi:fluoroquinolone resistance protein
MRDRLLADESFEDQTFEGIDVAGADLSDKEFVRCTFRSVRMQETIWTGTRLEDCVFQTCDLTRLQPKKLSLRGVKFLGSKLMGIDWTDAGANPTVAFSDCTLRYCSFLGNNLRATPFRHCALTEAAFADVSLVGAVFEECDLGGTRFEGCDLAGADFTRAQGVFFEPTKNRVKGAKIPLETAALMAMSFGLVVAGFTAD